MMKRAFILAVSAAMMICCAGCVGVNFSTVRAGAVLGKGPMTAVEYDLGPYTAVEIHSERGEMELYYTAAQSDKVKIELQENLAEHLDVSVQDGVLIIETDKPIESENGRAPRLYLSAPVLKEMVVDGGLAVKEADTVKGDSFTLNISGAIDGTLSFEVDTLDVDISGACDLTLTGSAEEVGIRTSGAGAIDASELQTKRAGIDISGAGDISVACSDALDVTISGTGSVEYKGDPHVTQKISGAAAVTRLD